MLLTGTYTWPELQHVPVSNMPSVAVQPGPLSRRPFGQNYAFVVVAVIFLALLCSAGLRTTPGVLMLPLQTAFGWNVGVMGIHSGGIQVDRIGSLETKDATRNRVNGGRQEHGAGARN